MEKIMQYIWQWRLYGSPDRRLIDGREVSIVHPGVANHAAGPDFFNARVSIDGACWAGNVELHLRASDWYRHGHDRDRAYDSVILHVVGLSDTIVTRPGGETIPQLHLPFNQETAERYRALAESSKPIRCAAWIGEMPRLHLCDWLDRAGHERLEMKSERMLGYVRFTNGDWSHALFIALARALGFGLNGEPLERLARMLPPNVAARHANSLMQLEALLMGMAGLLNGAGTDAGDNYYYTLRSEYGFLAHKYNLKCLPAGSWKLSGTRPGNLPYRRLALLARLLQRRAGLFSSILDARADVERLLQVFDIELGEYWSHHFTFGAPTSREYAKALSRDMACVLLVNVAAPFYRAYGLYRGETLTEELGEKLLTSLPPERNSVMKMWADVAALRPANAFESQALLHIKTNMCERSECLRCRLGHKLLRASACESRTPQASATQPS